MVRIHLPPPCFAPGGATHGAAMGILGLSEAWCPAKLKAKTGPINMYYVYLLQSESNPEQRYVGFSSDLKKRLRVHNSGGSVHTSKYRPWCLAGYTAIRDKGVRLRALPQVPLGAGFRCQATVVRNAWPPVRLRMAQPWG